MYIEASSPRQRGDNAKLELTVPGSGAPACLEFYFHMYGATMGYLTVFSGNAVVFNVSGTQGFSWKKATRTIYLDNTVSLIGFEFSCSPLKDLNLFTFVSRRQNLKKLTKMGLSKCFSFYQIFVHFGFPS